MKDEKLQCNFVGDFMAFWMRIKTSGSDESEMNEIFKGTLWRV